MWYNYFLGLIAIVSIIRLVLISAGSMSAQEKVSKASWWLIGLVMISISWAILGNIFGTNVGKIGNGSIQNTTPKKSDYKTGGYFKDSKTTEATNNESVEIRISTKTEEE